MENILSRADLRTLWLLGHPVRHSMSPLIQNAALRHLNQAIIYQAADVSVEDFESAVHGLVALGAIGANVTVPHKEAAFRICHQRTPRAEAIGACNVLHFSQGRILGDNTDGSGWWRGLTDILGRTVPEKAVVVGAGGAARAVVYTLARNKVPEIVVLNRTLERAETLVREFLPYALTRCYVRPLESFPEQLKPDCLVVQTTSAGLDGGSSPLTLPDRWPAGAVLSELIYGKETPLGKAVKALGGKVQDGLAMLVYQAAESLALWLDRPLQEIPAELMMKTARQRVSVVRSEHQDSD